MIRLKGYSEFIKESSAYQYGCVMAEVPISNWSEIIKLIDEEDIYNGNDDIHGIQNNPHLTFLYPVLNNVKFEEIVGVLRDILDKKINIKIDKIDYFENSEFDVVKFNIVENDYLTEIHNKLKSNISNDDKYDIYRPHITISYVNKGTGIKYLRDYEFSFDIDKITYTESDGTKNHYNI